ncbi:MAG: hypothetical protein LBG20_02990 [Holosporaceae bacterium]|nr:hypothetical protein [Holosporaceae bacterium]
MRSFFIFLGICGSVMLIAAVTALFIGIPATPREVVRQIEFGYASPTN